MSPREALPLLTRAARTSNDDGIQSSDFNNDCRDTKGSFNDTSTIVLQPSLPMYSLPIHIFPRVSAFRSSEAAP